MKRLCIPVCCFFVFLVMGAMKAEDKSLPTVDSVIQRYLESVGGREALERLTSRVCRGRLEQFLVNEDPQRREWPLQALAQAPHRWIAELKLEAGEEKEGFDGKNGWKLDGAGLRYDSRLERSLFGAWIRPDGPLALKEWSTGMVVDRMERRGDRHVVILLRKGAADRSKTLTFDMDTGWLIGIDTHVFLKDYRQIDGIWLPYRFEISRKGGYTAYIFEEVGHDMEIDPARLRLPEINPESSAALEGLTDLKVVPLLRNLPYREGGMNVPIQDGRFLYDLIVKNGFQRGLEIGTSNGYSTLWLGLAFRKTGGRVITIEYEPKRAREAIENFEKAGLEDIIDARIADAFEEIPRLEGPFDFVFLDSWKPDYLRFLEIIRHRIVPGGIIAAHNVNSHDRDMLPFLDAIRNDPKLDTKIYELSEAGMVVCRVKKKKTVSVD